MSKKDKIYGKLHKKVQKEEQAIEIVEEVKKDLNI